MWLCTTQACFNTFLSIYYHPYSYSPIFSILVYQDILKYNPTSEWSGNDLIKDNLQN